jgi:RNA polymerase sigma-70 factor (ECF subfamily)
MKTSATAPTQEQAATAKAGTARDTELVRRFKAGDEAAFTEIVQRHYSRIRALAQQTLHNAGDAEEIAQDTFIRAHRALHNFRGDCTLASWLYRIGLNLARNRYWFHFRRHRQDTLSLDRTMVEDGTVSLAGVLSDGLAAPRTESMTNEFVGLVAQCMDRLDASHREILQMRTALNLSYEEIADRLGLNVGTVKSRIARARERLRDLLRQVAPEFGRHASAADFLEIDRPLTAPGFVLA